MTALDRHNITRALDASLKRLGTDYVDLYQTHWPDPGLAYDETMEVLDDLIRAGKIRVVGCSNETSYGLMKSLATSEKLGVARYHTIQNNYSINNRRFEDELKQVCRKKACRCCLSRPWAGGCCQANIWTVHGLKARVFRAIWRWRASDNLTWHNVSPGPAHWNRPPGWWRLRMKQACRR